MIDYYFVHEFQWKDEWFSKTGISKPVVRADSNFKFNSYVDFSILESVILHTKQLNKYSTALELLTEINVKLLENKPCGITNEIASLEMSFEYSRPIDNLGSSDGIDSPLSWNIITDLKYQYIPTSKVLNLLTNWIKFLKIIDDSPPSF